MLGPHETLSAEGRAALTRGIELFNTGDYHEALEAFEVLRHALAVLHAEAQLRTSDRRDPDLAVFRVSATTGEGMAAWLRWIAAGLAALAHADAFVPGKQVAHRAAHAVARRVEGAAAAGRVAHRHDQLS